MSRKLTEERAASHGIGPAGQGHNGFPTHAEIQMAVNEQVQWNLKRQELNAKISTFRKGLRAKGITLGLLDDKVRKLEWTPEEIKKDHEESAWYAEAMRFPVGAQLEFFGGENTPDLVREQLRWKSIGHKNGLAGIGWPDEAPDGCPPECVQSYGEGWEEGGALVRRAFAERQKGLQPLAPATADETGPDDGAADGDGDVIPESTLAPTAVIPDPPAGDADWQQPSDAEAQLEEAAA